MSDIPPTTEQRTLPTKPLPAKETSPLRLILLLSVFGIALAGLLYDYTIARPAIQKADQIIKSLLDGSREDPNNDGGVTEAEVQELLGCAPSTVNAQENYKIETYSWRSGLPYRTYNLYVVYQGQRLPLLYSSSTNDYPQADQLPPKSIIPREMTEEEKANFVPRRPVGAGGPGAGGPGKKMDRKKERRAEDGKAPAKRGGGGAKSATPPTDSAEPQEPGPAMDPGPENTTPSTEPAQEEAAPAAEPAKEESAPSAEPTQPEPAKEEPAPSAEPAKEEPAPSAEPTQPEPAKEEPAPSAEPAKEEPAPPAEPTQPEPAKEQPADGGQN